MALLQRAGQLGAVAGRWRDASDVWAAYGCPFDSGLALARSGDRQMATAAVSAFERIGARGATDRTRAGLRARGCPAPRAPRWSAEAANTVHCVAHGLAAESISEVQEGV